MSRDNKALLHTVKAMATVAACYAESFRGVRPMFAALTLFFFVATIRDLLIAHKDGTLGGAA